MKYIFTYSIVFILFIFLIFLNKLIGDSIIVKDPGSYLYFLITHFFLFFIYIFAFRFILIENKFPKDEKLGLYVLFVISAFLATILINAFLFIYIVWRSYSLRNQVQQIKEDNQVENVSSSKDEDTTVSPKKIIENIFDLMENLLEQIKTEYIKNYPHLEYDLTEKNNYVLYVKLHNLLHRYKSSSFDIKNYSQIINEYIIEIEQLISRELSVKPLGFTWSKPEEDKKQPEPTSIEDTPQKDKPLSKKQEHINQWGEYLAKYKYPEEFNITLSKEELGKRYERYIGYCFEKDEWKVEYNGIIKGLEDRGVDLYVRKKNKLLIVQCKRYGKDRFVRENTIQQLKGVLDTEIRKNPNSEVKATLFTPNDNLDENAQNELNYSAIKHIVKQHPLNEDYPLIKCNITDKKSGKQKIYHLPGVGMYDRIKIEYKKGESYVFTEEEAERRGFRSINK